MPRLETNRIATLWHEACFTPCWIFEEDVHVYEHVNVPSTKTVIVEVRVLVHVAVDGFWLRSGPFEKPATIKPLALPEDTTS